MNNTARNFALQLGALVSLYISISSLLLLIFSVINLNFPAAADLFWQVENFADSVRFSLAVLIVFFPTYITLTRVINVIRRRDTDGAYLGLTRWLIYLSLLVGGGVLLGDLVVVINTFLQGDITIRFILKALTLLVVIGVAFYYYLKDAQGYWQAHERGSIGFGAGVTLVVIVALVLGFYHTDTPSVIREGKIDHIQVDDLQDMHWRISDYAQVNDTLPVDLAAAYEGRVVPTAPEGRAAYQYQQLNETTYQLCATFSGKSTAYESYASSDWAHEAGEWCFKHIAVNIDTF